MNKNGFSHLFRRCKGGCFGCAGSVGSSRGSQEGQGSQEGSADGDDIGIGRSLGMAAVSGTSVPGTISRKIVKWGALAALILSALVFLACPAPTDSTPTEKPGTEQPGKSALTGDVSISGAMKPGATLTINVANTNGTGAATYKWTKSKDGSTTDITGANGQTFALTDAEIGYILGAIVSYADQTGTISGKGGSAVVKELQALMGNVAITGTPKVNKTLTADTTGLTNAEGTASYQWKNNEGNIAGANTQTFKIPASEFGKEITVVVSYSGNTGSAESVKTGAVAMPDFENVSISITGSNLLGGTLSAAINDPEGNAWGTPTFAWTHDETDGAARGAAQTVDLDANDIGKKLKVVAQYQNGQMQTATNNVVPTPTFDISLSGAAEITNPATSISMNPQFTNVFGTPSVSYSWTVDGVPAGATQSLAITTAHDGKTITGNATVAEYKGWLPPSVSKPAGTAAAKNFGTPGRNVTITNKSSTPDTQTPWQYFDNAYEQYVWDSSIGYAKFAKISVVFVDNINSGLNAHDSEVKGVTGSYELVVYINPVTFATETAEFDVFNKRNRAASWIKGELALYNDLVKAAPAKALPRLAMALPQINKQFIQTNNFCAAQMAQFRSNAPRVHGAKNGAWHHLSDQTETPT